MEECFTECDDYSGGGGAVPDGPTAGNPSDCSRPGPSSAAPPAPRAGERSSQDCLPVLLTTAGKQGSHICKRQDRTGTARENIGTSKVQLTLMTNLVNSNLPAPAVQTFGETREIVCSSAAYLCEGCRPGCCVCCCAVSPSPPCRAASWAGRRPGWGSCPGRSTPHVKAAVNCSSPGLPA